MSALVLLRHFSGDENGEPGRSEDLEKGDKWHVIGRRTSVICDSFDEAWEESIPYFAARKW